MSFIHAYDSVYDNLEGTLEKWNNQIISELVEIMANLLFKYHLEILLHNA